MYSKEELKKIKISIKRNIPSIDDNTNEEIVDYSFSSNEKLPIHTRPLEGTKPLFDDKVANNPKRYSSSISSRESSPFCENEKIEIDNVMNRLDKIMDEVKEKTKEAYKRTRSGRNSSDSECSRSPRKKRMRRDSNYGHSSKRARNKSKNKNRYRDRSCSSNSDRSFSSYLSKKLGDDMSSLLNVSITSNHSRRDYENYSRNNRKSYERETNKHDDYYRNESYYHDMKERYARYYTVMYAFNIIMDILRKDDLYNNHY